MAHPARNAAPATILSPSRIFFAATKTSMSRRLLQSERNAKLLIDVMRSLVAELRSTYEMVVCDTTSQLTEITLEALENSDHIVLAEHKRQQLLAAVATGVGGAATIAMVVLVGGIFADFVFLLPWLLGSIGLYHAVRGAATPISNTAAKVAAPMADQQRPPPAGSASRTRRALSIGLVNRQISSFGKARSR